jgi:hypothetical protein
MKMMKRLGKTFFCTTKIKEIYFLGWRWRRWWRGLIDFQHNQWNFSNKFLFRMVTIIKIRRKKEIINLNERKTKFREEILSLMKLVRYSIWRENFLYLTVYRCRWWWRWRLRRRRTRRRFCRTCRNSWFIDTRCLSSLSTEISNA